MATIATRPTAEFKPNWQFLVPLFSAALLSILGGCSRQTDSELEHDHDRDALLTIRAVGVLVLELTSNDGTLLPPTLLDQESNVLCSWRFKVAVNTVSGGEGCGERSDNWKSQQMRCYAELMPVRETFAWDINVLNDRTSRTQILGIAGRDTFFGNSDSPQPNLGDIPIDLVMLIGVSTPDVEVFEPRDFNIDIQFDGTAIDATVGDYGITHVCFADGVVWALKNDTPILIFRKLVTVQDALLNSRESVLSKYRDGI